jgi:hypothetical protein
MEEVAGGLGINWHLVGLKNSYSLGNCPIKNHRLDKTVGTF